MRCVSFRDDRAIIVLIKQFWANNFSQLLRFAFKSVRVVKGCESLRAGWVFVLDQEDLSFFLFEIATRDVFNLEFPKTISLFNMLISFILLGFSLFNGTDFLLIVLFYFYLILFSSLRFLLSFSLSLVFFGFVLFSTGLLVAQVLKFVQFI